MGRGPARELGSSVPIPAPGAAQAERAGAPLWINRKQRWLRVRLALTFAPSFRGQRPLLCKHHKRRQKSCPNGLSPCPARVRQPECRSNGPRDLMGVRRAALVCFALSFVTACAKLPEYREDPLTTADIVLNIKCELRDAAW